MKLDPYNNKENYFIWKEKAEKGIVDSDIGEYNRKLVLQYLQDMEIGINVGKATKKGARSFIHIHSLKTRLISIIRKLKIEHNITKITDVSDEQIHILFSKMSNGTITKPNGGKYLAVSDCVKVFKAFWHWYQRISKKKGIEIPDITTDLDTKEEKPDWVYLTEEQVKTLADKALYKYKVLIWFLFDTGIRAPTELMNIKVSDFYGEFKELQIRNEISKTFGRRIKLMLCSDIIKEYIKSSNLSQNDYVFKINPATVNKYLGRICGRFFGDKQSPAGQKYSDLTMYDFRHISCCYWLPRYKNESALKYRFGWKGSDKIHYYSELLGMKDTISEEDMLLDLTRTEIEKRMLKSEKELEITKDLLKISQTDIAELKKTVLQLAKVLPIPKDLIEITKYAT